MLLVRHTRMNVSIADLYFGDRNDLLSLNTDVIIAYQNIDLLKGSTPFLTIHIDLRKSMRSLFTSLDRDVRSHVSRTEDNGDIAVVINTSPNNKSIALFERFYNVVAASRRLPECRHAHLQLLAKYGGLTLSSAYDDKGALLVAHAYVTDGKRARALYSASDFRGMNNSEQRALYGRANRVLHWKDIANFKEQSYEMYDLGGIGDISKNPELAGINQFKMKFGGVQTIEYNLTKATTCRGRYALLLQKYLKTCKAAFRS